MAKKLVSLSLPEWAFLDAETHEGNLIGTRTIVEHVPTGTILEIFDRDFDTFVLKPDVLTFNFKNDGLRVERLIIALHRSFTMYQEEDRDKLLGLMKRCAVWYCDYCDWFDRQEW